MRAKKAITADQYFRELEAWAKAKTHRKAGCQVIDFMEAKRRRAANQPPGEVDRSDGG